MGIKTNRISWLDNAKMLAMLCVIVYHVGSFSPMGEVGNMIESFNMPLFMILSGYACYHSLFKEKTINEWLVYIKRNFVRIMVPCIFMSAWATPWTHDKLFFLHGYWFLHCLFSILLAFAVVAIVGGMCGKKLFGLPVIMVIIFMLFVRRNNLSEMTPYFAIGLILRKYDVLNFLYYQPKATRRTCIMGGAILWLILFKLCYKSFYLFPFADLMKTGEVYIYILRHVQGAVMAVVLIMFTEMLSRDYNRFSYWGSKTLGMYLVHVFIVDYIVNINGIKIVPTGNVLIDMVLSLIAAAALSVATIIICKLSSMTRITRMLVLGEK